MKIRRGAKGKYFTDVVRKHPVRATIRTVQETIIGFIHLHPEARTLDELNSPGDFLAVTEATIETGDASVPTDFVAVNKAHILWVNPREQDGLPDG